MKEPDLVDDINEDGTGWARFDSTRRYRYRLGRAISERARELSRVQGITICAWRDDDSMKRIVFVLLNPSTADAFKGDRTVDKCTRYAELWGGFDVIEVVNIFALRSPYPEDVKQAATDDRGAGPANDEQIIAAISRAGVTRVVAGWGNHGALDDRGAYVRNMLEGLRDKARESNGMAPFFLDRMELLALKILPGGVPIHPLARGKQFLPLNIEPVPFP